MPVRMPSSYCQSGSSQLGEVVRVGMSSSVEAGQQPSRKVDHLAALQLLELQGQPFDLGPRRRSHRRGRRYHRDPARPTQTQDLGPWIQADPQPAVSDEVTARKGGLEPPSSAGRCAVRRLHSVSPGTHDRNSSWDALPLNPASAPRHSGRGGEARAPRKAARAGQHGDRLPGRLQGSVPPHAPGGRQGVRRPGERRAGVGPHVAHRGHAARGVRFAPQRRPHRGPGVHRSGAALRGRRAGRGADPRALREPGRDPRRAGPARIWGSSSAQRSPMRSRVRGSPARSRAFASASSTASCRRGTSCCRGTAR